MVQGIFLDIESNGLDCYRHRVMQIAFCIVQLETGECTARYESNVHLSLEEWDQSDSYSLRVNGLTNYALHSAAPSRSDVGAWITSIFKEQGVHRDRSLFICQNPSFDRPFFAQLVSTYQQESYGWPYHWLDLASMFWSRHAAKERALPCARLLGKDAIATALNLSPEAKPHRAMGGVEHLVNCYGALVGWPVARLQSTSPSSTSMRPLGGDALTCPTMQALG